MVLEDLALRQEALNELRVLVPTEQFGSVMGHRGETIRRIMQVTGANLQQHKAEKTKDGGEYRFRLVQIKGDEHQRVEVVRHVHVALESRGRSAVAVPGTLTTDFDLGFGLDSLGTEAAMQGSAG